MKMITMALISLLATSAFGASVKSAKLDAEKKNLVIDVVYGGGCGEHKFSLELEPCLETFPVRCSAKLIEKTTDGCEALIHETVVIPLAKYGLTDSYFSRGSLTIHGDRDSQATVRLP